MTLTQIYQDNNLHLQQTPYTCGPASILNALALKGNHDFDEAQLADLCKIDPTFGTSNENLLDAIEKTGLNIIEHKADASIDDIKRNLDHGAIVIVNYFDPFSNEGHYAVVSEYDEQALYLRDSWFGLLRLSIKRFDPVWHSGDNTATRWYVAIA